MRHERCRSCTPPPFLAVELAEVVSYLRREKEALQTRVSLLEHEKARLEEQADRAARSAQVGSDPSSRVQRPVNMPHVTEAKRRRGWSCLACSILE
jgi:hypothetical protein